MAVWMYNHGWMDKWMIMDVRIGGWMDGCLAFYIVLSKFHDEKAVHVCTYAHIYILCFPAAERDLGAASAPPYRRHQA